VARHVATVDHGSMNDDAATVTLWRPTGLDRYEVHQVGGQTILEYLDPGRGHR
jgi:hypothetical protein